MPNSFFLRLFKQWALEDGAENPQVEVNDKSCTVEYTFVASVDAEDYGMFFNGFENDRLLALSMYHRQDTVPQERGSEIARLLNLINDQQLKRGNFELTDNDRVRFRDQIASIGEELPYDIMDAMVQHGMRRFGDALPKIRKVALAGFSAEAAMADPDDTSEFLETTRVKSDDVPSWQHFPGAEVIQRWAASVRSALDRGTDTSIEDWQLIGPAIGIEHPFYRIGESLAQRIAADCGIPLHVIAADDLKTLKDNLRSLETVAPILVYLEAGAWQKFKEEDKDGDDPEGREQVMALLRAFNPAHPVFVMTVARSMGEIAATLRRSSAFDRWFELPPITPQAQGELFLDLVGRERCGPSLTQSPAKVGKLLDRSFDAPELRKLAALRMRRKHAELGRHLEFLDLVNMDSQGLLESDSMLIEDEKLRQRVAWHEAGHATMALLDSDGQDIPEFTSIIPHGSSNGVVVDSVDYHYTSTGNRTYAAVCHGIRVSLAGRAAEEVVFGPAEISNGCRGDLASSYRLASDAFASWGFMPGMDGKVPSENNLAVILGTPTPSEYAHLETMVREFLAAQYRLVRAQLTSNRPLLAAIHMRLMETAILDQQEMAQLYVAVRENLPQASLNRPELAL